MARLKQPRLGEISVASPQSTVPPDQTAGALIQGAGAIAEFAAKEIGERKQAEAAAREQSVLNEFEDELLDVSLSGLIREQDVAASAEEEGLQLSENEKRALSSAKAEARRIDLMEGQTGSADKASWPGPHCSAGSSQSTLVWRQSSGSSLSKRPVRPCWPP